MNRIVYKIDQEHVDTWRTTIAGPFDPHRDRIPWPSSPKPGERFISTGARIANNPQRASHVRHGLTGRRVILTRLGRCLKGWLGLGRTVRRGLCWGGGLVLVDLGWFDIFQRR